MAQKERLDVILTEQGYYPNRSKAKRAIMAGIVVIDGEVVDKAGTMIKTNAEIKIKGHDIPYVSRGGLKLERALQVFSVNAVNKEAIDIGASTGGFTDCLLQNGASKVYAIDVGYGQLAWKLRQDKRVEVIERTNFRYLTSEVLPIRVPIIVTDVSFISLKLIIPPAKQFLIANGDVIGLIKPQFEAGPERVGKNGVVKDSKIHQDVLHEMSYFFVEQGFNLKDLNYSPITGASSKNIEFLIHLQYNLEDDVHVITDEWFDKITKTVELAHQELF